MKRRAFIGTAAAGGVSGAMGLSCGRRKPKETTEERITGVVEKREIPEKLLGMILEELRKDYHNRLFNTILPFWDKGGVDQKFGGFMCTLNPDGSVANEEKDSLSQGRGLWVYSFLYNNFGKDKRFLDIAAKAHDFIVGRMYAKDGVWHERLNRNGSVKQAAGASVNGGLAIAAGLGEFYRATGNDEDYKLILETVWATLRTYDNPLYTGTVNKGGIPAATDCTGFRSRETAALMVAMLTPLLNDKRNFKLDDIVEEHVRNLTNAFTHPYLGITNEYLLHDWTRVPGSEDHMYTGGAIETQWILLMEALRQGDRRQFDAGAAAILRYISLGWDDVFEGFGDGHFYVFDGPERTRDKLLGVKTMRSHADILLATMHIIEFSGAAWAVEWFERTAAYYFRCFDTATRGVQETVDRFGNTLPYTGASAGVRDIYHTPRHLMMNILSLDRMIANKGKLSPLHYPIEAKKA